MEQIIAYFDKDTTKFPQELCQILEEVAHRSPTSRRFRQLGSYVVSPVDSFAGPELSLGLVAKPYGNLFFADSFLRRILGRTPQRTSHYFDSLFGEILASGVK